MYNLWILVADKCNARLFQRFRPAARLRLIQNFDHPEGRMKDREFYSDRPGRHLGPRTVHRHGYTSHITPDQRSASEFANQLASVFERARSQNEFDGLVVVAGPEMLGLIRSAMSERTRDRIVRSIIKDLRSCTEREILGLIGDQLAEIDQSPRLEGENGTLEVLGAR